MRAALRWASLLVLIVVSLLATAASAVDSANGPRLGTWTLTGFDQREWSAVLVFTRRVGLRYDGYFIWQSESGVPSSGTEPFQGLLDPSKQLLTLKGIDLKDKQGSIASGSIYEATVSADGRHLKDGRWFGPGVVPGTFTADWTSDEGRVGDGD